MRQKIAIIRPDWAGCTMQNRWFLLLAVLPILTLPAFPRIVRADQYELSLHMTAETGLARLGDAHAGKATDRVPVFGYGIRATYGLRHWLTAEAGLAACHALSAATYPRDDGTTLTRRVMWMGADVGVGLRYGVEVIPFVRLSAALQPRYQGDGRIKESHYTRDAEPVWSLDLVGNVVAGIDYRINQNVVIGMHVEGSYAAPVVSPHYHGVSLMLHAGYYFYPRWRL